MCGIFGIIGDSDTPQRDFEILALANRDRGQHSFGMFDGREVFHYVGDPMAGLPQVPESMYQNTRLLCGHTRNATHGAKTKENCHPFTIGRITGAHNGVISNFSDLKKEHHQEFEVDSQMIFYLIDQKWRQGFSELRGSMAVWFYDKTRPEHFYLARNDSSPLHVIETDRRVIFSSDWEALKILEPAEEALMFGPKLLWRLHIPTLKFKTKNISMLEYQAPKITYIGFDADEIDDTWYNRYRQTGRFSPQPTNWGQTRVGVEKHSPSPIILPKAQTWGNKGFQEPEPTDGFREEMEDAGLFWCHTCNTFIEAGTETCMEHPDQGRESPHICVYCGKEVPGAGDYIEQWNTIQQAGDSRLL